MSYSFSNLKLRWLTEGAPVASEILAASGDLAAHPFPFPPELGWGHIEFLQLPYKCGFWRATQHFLPAARGQLIPMGEYEFDFGEPTFSVQTVRGGRHCHRDLLPEKTLIFEEGRDLFSNMVHRRAIPMPDGSFDSVSVAITIPISGLGALLGEAESLRMLEALGIAAPPSCVSQIMPKSLASILHGAMTKSLLGSTRKLYLQAKVLEYLSALSDHLNTSTGAPLRGPSFRENIRALHAHLLDLEGKIPALEELSRQFGLPARRLNDEFKREYGDSIVAFIASHRLSQARVALMETELPIKVLSDRLGYSHVNHFSNAFKRHFGVSPGSLRRRNV